jgi:hypothetical protein
VAKSSSSKSLQNAIQEAEFLVTIYNLFPAYPHLRINLFLVGHELKLLSHKVHAHVIHISCIDHLKMTKNAKKVHYYLDHNSCSSHSFVIHRQLKFWHLLVSALTPKSQAKKTRSHMWLGTGTVFTTLHFLRNSRIS